jgi:hypothetical protein
MSLSGGPVDVEPNFHISLCCSALCHFDCGLESLHLLSGMEYYEAFVSLQKGYNFADVLLSHLSLHTVQRVFVLLRVFRRSVLQVGAASV